MRNRIIAIILVIALIPCMLAAPVSAEDNYTFNVLDYSLPNGGNFSAFNLSGSGSDVVYFNLPFEDSYYYVDFIIRTDAVLTSIVCINEGVNIVLNQQLIDSSSGSLIRVYGNLTGWSFDQILLQFNYSSGNIVFFLDFDISNYLLTNYEIPFVGTGLTSANQTLYLHRSGTDVVNCHFNVSSLEGSSYWDLTFEPINHQDWKKYDFLDLVFVIISGSVDSISCYINGTLLPFDVNYINDSSIQSGVVHVSLRIYLDDIDRSISDYPIVNISGSSYLGVNSIGILSCSGFVVPSEPSQLRYWFTKIGDWFSNQIFAITSWGKNIVDSISSWGQKIVEAINPDASAADDVIENSSDKSNQVSDLTSQMDNMQKPDLSGSGDISSIISPGDLTSYTTFLSTVINAPYISQVVMLSLILSLAAYVLFGKR